MTSGSEKRKAAKCRKNSPISEEVSTGGDSCGESILKKGPWTSDEDEILRDFVENYGEGNWNAVQTYSGLLRCGKSCRLRWANHLKPDLKRGPFSVEEESQIIKLHAKMGNKWARMATEMPGRTDNEIKNFWNTRSKRLQRAGLPLYPPGVHTQHQQNDDMMSCESGDMHHPEASETNGIDIPEVKFHDFDIQKNLKHSWALFDIHPPCLLQNGVNSSNSYGYMPSALNPNKRFREMESPFYASVESTSNTFPAFKQHGAGMCRWLPSAPPLLSSTDHINGNSSSSDPISEAMKTELPSFQYPPLPSHESFNNLIQSPRSEQTQSNCPSLQNTGLLEALVYEPKSSRGSNDHSYHQFQDTPVIAGDGVESSSLNLSETIWDTDPISPNSQSTASAFVGSGGCSSDKPQCAEPMPALNPYKHFREVESQFYAPVESTSSTFPGFNHRETDIYGIIYSAQILFLSPDHINGNSSSSSNPFSEGMKMEPPSLQFSTSPGSRAAPCSPLPSHESFDKLVQSPRSEHTQSNCPSPRNSGLLEALVYEPKSSRGSNDHSYHQFQDTSVVAGNGVAGNVDPISPNSQSTASAFVGSGGCSSDEPQSAEPMPGKFDRVVAESDMKNDILFPTGYLRPDAVLDSFCCNDSLITGDLGSLLGEINYDFEQYSRTTSLMPDQLTQYFEGFPSQWDYPSSALYPSLKQY